VFELSAEPKAAFLLAFDPETLELVVLRRYHSANAALPALFRQNDEGKLATIVQAENEAALRAMHDIEKIARGLRQRCDEGERNARKLKAVIASLPYPERRVFELCDKLDGQSLSEAGAAAEIGCSVKTVRRLRRRAGGKVMFRFEQECRRNAH
jgi:DNA-directed RNA polymerase specialized sigma24 family protein